jgi:cell division protein FtsB
MLTWRTAVVVGVLALAFAVVAPSVRAYMDQQAMLETLRGEANAAQIEVEDLEADVARWDDPAFVVAQARERLAYVFPGETPYRVVDPETVTGPADGSPAAERSPDALVGGAWYDRLWDSVVVAGEGAALSEAELPAAPEVLVSPDPAAGDEAGASPKVDSAG